MKIRYLSDLHLEFIKPHKIQKYLKNIKPDLEEICILAGDIGNPYKEHYKLFMEYINQSFKHTFVITGNHEYYNNDITETNEYLMEYFKQYDHITFLNNNYELYDNYYFIGTTLWSKITNPLYEINDVHKIKDFTYLKCNSLNMLAIDFLEHTMEEILENNKNIKNIIIITHHVPSYELINSKYLTTQMRPYNQWFNCNMNSFIDKYNELIIGWFYGHTHSSAYNILHNIHFCCNPIGYPNENHKIDYNKTIEF
jgi:predicted phosphohydrolase